MTVRARWSLAAVALAAVAAVVLLLWPRPPAGVDAVAGAGPYQVRLLVAAPSVGARDVLVEVTGPPAERVVVAPVMSAMGHASVPVTAAATAPGRYRAVGVELFMAGRWDVAVVVHGAGGPAEAVFPVVVGP
ncbi:hypothetical protein BJF78_27050 [Pseudonocardia sp. CNS-139]|nr:hypothetical protein BJF78_27050 [Pseudonocardia sp. CNS-139]